MLLDGGDDGFWKAEKTELDINKEVDQINISYLEDTMYQSLMLLFHDLGAGLLAMFK